MPFTTQEGYVFFGDEPSRLGAPSEMILAAATTASEALPPDLQAPETTQASAADYVAELLSKQRRQLS